MSGGGTIYEYQRELTAKLEQVTRERDEARAALADDAHLAEWEKRGVVDSAVIAKLREARAERDHFKEQLRERAEALLDARTEIERLRLELKGWKEEDHFPALSMADLRIVAVRQREACARAAEEDVSLGRTHDAVRATPLVTEGDK